MFSLVTEESGYLSLLTRVDDKLIFVNYLLILGSIAPRMNKLFDSHLFI